MEFRRTTLRRVMEHYGIERATKEAVDEFGEILEKMAGYICEEAAYLAEKNNRKTIKREDILRALRRSDRD